MSPVVTSWKDSQKNKATDLVGGRLLFLTHSRFVSKQSRRVNVASHRIYSHPGVQRTNVNDQCKVYIKTKGDRFQKSIPIGDVSAF